MSHYNQLYAQIPANAVCIKAIEIAQPSQREAVERFIQVRETNKAVQAIRRAAMAKKRGR